MPAASITSLIVTSELRANRVGPRGVRISPVGSRFGGKATHESTPSTLSPVVRVTPLRRLSSALSW